VLREQTKLFNRLSISLDLLILFLSFFIAYHLVPLPDNFTAFSSYAWILVLIFPLWTLSLFHNRLYSSIRRMGSIDIFVRLFKAQVEASFILGFLIWILDKDHFSRSLFLTFVAVSFVALLIVKIGQRKALGIVRMRHYNTRNLLIVGTRDKAKIFYDLLQKEPDWGLRVIGFLQATEGEPLQESVLGHKVLGYGKDLLKVCKEFPVDEVVFCLPKDLIVDAESYMQDLEELGITVRMVIDYFDIYYTRKTFELFHNELPILTFHSKSLDAQQLMLKRMLDISGSIVGLSILCVLFPFIAIAIKKESPGPLFFGQERVGESGRRFTCWKFRSMYMDAEERKAELLAQNEMKGAIFKIKNDPRITKVGNFLRKTSLDELPQFWNVLKGDMSLVGTRPPTPEEVDQYENWHRRRISIKPGITGMWQVSGRNKIEDFDEIVRLDLAYIDAWNIGLDIKLLLQTLKVVFFREGSY